MMAVQIPIGVKLGAYVEELPRAKDGKPFRARVRWTNPETKQRQSKSEVFATEDEAEAWIERMRGFARRGVDPTMATMRLGKGTKGKRMREVPLVAEIRQLVSERIASKVGNPDARVFTGPRGGRIATDVFRRATHWDHVVERLGYEHLRRHDLRHTAITWFADAGVPVHHLQRIAGHGQLTTTQRYLHPSRESVHAAGELLSGFMAQGGSAVWPTNGPQLRIVRE